MKMFLLEAEFFHAGGQKDRRTERQTDELTEGQRDLIKKIVALGNFAEPSKKK
jgi:hypothetical protein